VVLLPTKVGAYSLGEGGKGEYIVDGYNE